MKTVADICLEALELKRQGQRLQKIAGQLIDIAHDNGFGIIKCHGSGGAGEPTIIGLTFPDGEVIHFDGTDWHHRVP